MFKNILHNLLTIITLICILNTPLYANDFNKWKADFIKEAIAAGISKNTATKTLEKVKSVNNSVLNLYNNQPEFKITLQKYMDRNITKKRIQKGRVLINKYNNVLENIFEVYGISPNIIVSIWAIESNFGYYTGTYNIIDALSTLSFKSKRKLFFKEELISALKIIDQKMIEEISLKGSWAGAMGQSQFMPSSYLNYAVDHNKDNRIDIWKTNDDVFGSIANYLQKHGWQKNKPWAFEIEKNIFANFEINKEYKLKEFKQYNIPQLNKLKLDQNTNVKIMKINNGKNYQYFMIFKNFYILKKYNNSNFYALTVGKLANEF